MKHVPFTTKKTLLFFIPAFICILLALHIQAQVCSNPNGVIYGLSNSGNIVPITVSNTSVGATLNPAYTSTTSSANALGYNPQDGKFYFFENSSSGTSQQFVSFDPLTNTYTTLAPSPITAGLNRGCISFNGTGYYCLDQNANLCYYDIPSNTWTLISSAFTDQYGNNVSATFKSQGSGDMAIDGLGNLWIVSSNTSTYGVYKISAPLPTTATTSVNITQLIAPTTATPGTNFAGIAFNATGEIYVCTPNDLYLLNNDLSLSHLGTFSIANVGGDLTSCNFPITVLPISWQSVTASLQTNNSVLINWVVNQQINSKEYTIEHSADGQKWSDLGTIQSTGNTTSAQSYAFTDMSPFNGNNYYRIRQEDLDDKTNFSIIKTVTTETHGQIAVWPNPAREIINIQNQANISGNNFNAEIFNQSGQKVSASSIHSGTNAVNISALPAGYYIVHIDLSNGESYNQKLVKL
jgi:hypothetical protein